MALTPEGTPYVESSDLVANYPAASLSLANRVDLVGVLPFASAAARTTAIPSPTDGQYSYLQDTNSTEFYNGSAWVAAGTAPGLVHINTTAFTAQTSVSLNSIFTTTYENYFVIVNQDTSAVQSSNMRLRQSGTDDSTSVYNYGINQNNYGGTGTSSGQANQSSWLTVSTDASHNPAVFSYNIYQPQINGVTYYTGNASWFDSFADIGGVFKTVKQFDGLTIFPAGGTITGTIRVFGYKNS